MSNSNKWWPIGECLGEISKIDFRPQSFLATRHNNSTMVMSLFYSKVKINGGVLYECFVIYIYRRVRTIACKLVLATFRENRKTYIFPYSSNPNWQIKSNPTYPYLWYHKKHNYLVSILSQWVILKLNTFLTLNNYVLTLWHMYSILVNYVLSDT